MKNIASILILVLCMSCNDECTIYKEGQELADSHILSMENIYPNCNDTLNFFHIAYYPNGNLAHMVEMLNKEKEGLYKSFYFDGTPEFVGYFSNGKKVGLWKRWKDGYYDEKNYIDNTINGKTFERHPQGTMAVGQYLNGKEEGQWKILTRDSIPSSIMNYKDGKLNGEYTDFYTNGNIKNIVLYKNDSLVELTAVYDIQGKQTLKNGNGKWISYTKDGEIKNTNHYKNSILIK